MGSGHAEPALHAPLLSSPLLSFFRFQLHLLQCLTLLLQGREKDEVEEPERRKEKAEKKEERLCECLVVERGLKNIPLEEKKAAELKWPEEEGFGKSLEREEDQRVVVLFESSLNSSS